MFISLMVALGKKGIEMFEMTRLVQGKVRLAESGVVTKVDL